MTVYGYARAVTHKIDDQTEKLYASGCSTVFSDFRISTDAPGDGWRELVETVKAGDAVRVLSWPYLTRDVRTHEFIRASLADLGVQVETLEP
ncbi:site-specific recombinase [Streptomyces sp. NBRC 110611]|uniref:recombinase family protein n=1 Tax=Streptomyces sp. NBRC 110611 TaxID=1621259 RepID=UPI000836E89B|nr:recombinase family protein [Streptomyces sp. NBRC 110611]GAU67316.1 site-specific recombinase [Streptomyces sp. NBRC 110611]